MDPYSNYGQPSYGSYNAYDTLYPQSNYNAYGQYPLYPSSYGTSLSNPYSANYNSYPSTIPQVPSTNFSPYSGLDPYGYQGASNIGFINAYPNYSSTQPPAVSSATVGGQTNYYPYPTNLTTIPNNLPSQVSYSQANPVNAISTSSVIPAETLQTEAQRQPGESDNDFYKRVFNIKGTIISISEGKVVQSQTIANQSAGSVNPGLISGSNQIYPLQNPNASELLREEFKKGKESENQQVLDSNPK